jgi:hypothetical protein
MEDSMRRSCAVAIAAVSAVMAGCGGGFTAGRDWDPATEATVFDDGIDLIDDPAKLSGEWEFQARQDVDARSNLADMVAVVNILSVQTTKDVDGTEAQRIDARVEKTMYGASPGRTLALKSPSSALGYALITRHEGRLTGTYIVFLRWFDQGDGTLGHHFHISPASATIFEMVNKHVTARKAQEAESK